MTNLKGIPERIWKHVDPQPDGCLLWRGRVNRDGYSRVSFGRKRTGYGHRLFYEAFVGEIPAGLTLDHLCRVRGCVNPYHLEPVTLRENIARGTGPIAENMAKTHCLRGHPLTEGNLSTAPSHRGRRRECRICMRERNARSTRRWVERNRRPKPTRTHCSKGHELTPDNIVSAFVRFGRRKCRRCHNEYGREYIRARRARRAALLATPEGIAESARINAELAAERDGSAA